MKSSIKGEYLDQPYLYNEYPPEEYNYYHDDQAVAGQPAPRPPPPATQPPPQDVRDPPALQYSPLMAPTNQTFMGVYPQQTAQVHYSPPAPPPAPPVVSQPPPPAPVTSTLEAYPDLTTYVNMNPNAQVPVVDLVFNDQTTCHICGRLNFMNLKRHLKIHETTPRFKCRFPKLVCNFKTNLYNRSFDFKRHLINKHFKFDVRQVRRITQLLEKMTHPGTCPCRWHGVGKEWLNERILVDENDLRRCPLFNSTANER